MVVCAWSSAKNEGTWMFLISSNIVVFIELDILLKGRPPSLPLLPASQYYSNHSCRVKYLHSLINPDSQHSEVYGDVEETHDFIYSVVMDIFRHLILLWFSRNPFRITLEVRNHFAAVVLHFLCIDTSKKHHLRSMLDHVTSKDYCLNKIMR